MSRYTDDAWVFLSVGDGAGHGWASLSDLIGMADSNNHSIPSREDLSGGVSRLVAAGLVETDGNRTRLTDAGKRAFKQANRHGRGHIERVFILGKSWEERSFPPEAGTSWSISKEDYDAAYGDYHSWAQAAIARITRDIRRR